MKPFCLALTVSLLSLLSACNSSAISTPQPLPSPFPTQTPPQVATATTAVATAVKPLASQPATDAPLIAYGEVKEGALQEPAAVDEWVFHAKAGERVNLVLNSQFDSYLELYNPAGDFMASNDDNNRSLNAAMFDVQIVKSGPHTIAVRSYGGGSGNYVLALTGGHPTEGAAG